ncbi:LysE family translocator [Photobacterium sp. OFAV2-7]|uniref:LysE family translocator n=1 Tax=Photobacterium sp. OFAV2-7 TaxID=2917748 RepID=UPI001EF56731|nr:LysE family translocator [Photobacterium sp. OFAV2-7]MCG7585299.1 LysE family translocator [Photobacterium sp. OFAV2-7]
MNLTELLSLLAITTITIITPGPDFLIVSRNSIVGSRRAGIITAFGVSTAIWVHITYSICIIRLASVHSVFLMDFMKYCGASYLLYLGYLSLRPSQTSAGQPKDKKRENYWIQGFLNNLFNPKATLFFISVFSQVISTDTVLLDQIKYGLVITAICLSWFTLVPCLLTTERIAPSMHKILKPLEKLAGILFIAYSLNTFLLM